MVFIFLLWSLGSHAQDSNDHIPCLPEKSVCCKDMWHWSLSTNKSGKQNHQSLVFRLEIQVKKEGYCQKCAFLKIFIWKFWKKVKLRPWGFWVYAQNTIIKLSPAVKIPHKKKKLEHFPMGNAWLKRKVLLCGLKVNKLRLCGNV